MGSLGWVDCNWCGSPVCNPYLMDNGPGALCERCWDRMEDGLPPPIQPDAQARCVQWLRLVFDTRQQAAASSSFPLEVRTVLAKYLVAWYMP